MTISTTASSVTLNGDGSNTVWNYSFLIPTAADVTVTTVVSGVSTVINPALYTITVGNPIGGTVTYPLSGSPLANGSTITIARTLPLTQTTELTSQGDFDPAVVEGALDYITMLIQDLNTSIDGINIASFEAAAASVTAAVNSFNSEYLGSHASSPAGTSAGQLYFNSATLQMMVYNGSSWQVTYNPSTGAVSSFNGRTGAIVPVTGDYTIGEISGAATVAATGAYADLTGKPSLATVATSGLYSDLTGKPSLATVATSGSYTDLSNKPKTIIASAVFDTTSGVITIKSSYNLSAINRLAAGRYQLVFTTTPANANYVVVATGEFSNTTYPYGSVMGNPGQNSTTAAEICSVFGTSQARADMNIIHVAIFAS